MATIPRIGATRTCHPTARGTWAIALRQRREIEEPKCQQRMAMCLRFSPVRPRQHARPPELRDGKRHTSHDHYRPAESRVQGAGRLHSALECRQFGMGQRLKGVKEQQQNHRADCSSHDELPELATSPRSRQSAGCQLVPRRAHTPDPRNPPMSHRDASPPETTPSPLRVRRMS